MHSTYYYGMTHAVFNLLFGTITATLCLALVVALVIHIAKESKQAFANTNVKNPGVLNALLYLGSFFVFAAIMELIRDQPQVMPPILLAVSLLTLGGGVLLYRFVKFLKPVGLAFAYTGAALMPFWYYAFTELGLAAHPALIISVAVSLVSFIIGALGVGSRFMGWGSYVFLILLGWVIPEGTSKLAVYSFYLWPILVGFIPMLFWIFRAKWLPLAFRRASQVLSYIIPIFVSILWYVSVHIPNFGQDYPFLRTATAALLLVYFTVYWLKTRHYVSMVGLRIAVQALLLCTVADAMNFSLFSPASESARLAMAIMWATGFTIQAGISMALSRLSKENKPGDIAIIIISLICVMITPSFMVGAGMNSDSFHIITAVSAALTALISGATAWLLKQANWLIATWIAILTIPSVLFDGLMTLPHWALFAIYAGISLFPALVLAIDARKNGKRMLPATITAIILSFIAMRSYSYCGDFSLEALAYFITSANFAFTALAIKSKNLAEVAIYAAALSACAFAGNIYDLTASNEAARHGRLIFFGSYDYYGIEATNAQMALYAVNAFIIGGSVLGVGLWREHGKKSQPRVVLGYCLFTISMFSVASVAKINELIIWPVVFLLEEVALMILGLFSKRKWMTISSIVVAILTVLLFVSGPSWMWIGIAGIALITVVVIQLTRERKPAVEAPKADDTNKPAEQ